MNDNVTRQNILKSFIREAEQGRRALDQWLATLQRWSLADVETSNDDFMDAVHELLLEGLLEFVDNSPSKIDKLREILTGVEQ